MTPFLQKARENRPLRVRLESFSIQDWAHAKCTMLYDGRYFVLGSSGMPDLIGRILGFAGYLARIPDCSQRVKSRHQPNYVSSSQLFWLNLFTRSCCILFSLLLQQRNLLNLQIKPKACFHSTKEKQKRHDHSIFLCEYTQPYDYGRYLSVAKNVYLIWKWYKCTLYIRLF